MVALAALVRLLRRSVSDADKPEMVLPGDDVMLLCRRISVKTSVERSGRPMVAVATAAALESRLDKRC